MATYGQNTDVDNVSEQLANVDAPNVRGIIIKANPGNSGTVYVDYVNPALTTTGYPLAANQEMTVQPSECTNLNLIYVIGSAINQLVSYRVL